MHARIINGQPELVSPAPFAQGSVQYPASVFALWSRAEKAALGLYEVETAAAPEGHRITGYTMALMGDAVVRTPVTEPITAAELRAAVSCTPVQFRAVLRTFERVAQGWSNGTLVLPVFLEPYNTMFAGQPTLRHVLELVIGSDPLGPMADAMNYASEFHRLSPHVAAISAMFDGISDEQIDAVFEIARGIE